MHIPELLAPVGSKKALIAAVENGADAIYFGGTLFSARQYASNFNREELEWVIDFAHIRGVKAYVTVNTLIKDSQLEEACDYLQFLCNSGADAVIVQDLGILKLLRQKLPDLPVHASTQMTIHNAQGVKFLKEMGVKRIVLAREMSLDEIKRIKAETGMEIEVFIHGAMCFSYSGQCLLSSMIGGRSGNRGYCAQPCRKKYWVKEVEGYLLSPKDLNMSEHIPDLVRTGIDSFKIEGRMKRPEYVAGVVRVYRKLIDRYFESPENFRVTDEEKHTLLQLFNRDFTTGYFFGNPGGDLMSRKYPHNRGIELGYVVDHDIRKKMVSIYLKMPLRIGDGIGAGVRETGFTVRSMYLDNKRVSSASPGSTVRIQLDHETARGEAIFKTYDAKLMTSLEIKNIRKVPVMMSFEARVDEHVGLRISDGENEIKIQGEIVNRAEKSPISRSSIEEQLRKLGNTIFEAQEIRFNIDYDIFIPLSELNSLRREAIARLLQVRAQRWKRQCIKPDIKEIPPLRVGSKPILSVNTVTIESFEAAVDGGADVVYIGAEMLGQALGKEDYIHAIEYGRKKSAQVFISTPRIVKNINDLKILDLSSDGFLVSNPGILHHIKNLNPSTPIVLDYPFNVFNKLTMEFLLKYGNRVTLSPELTLKEINVLTQFGNTECIVHGNFPLMVSEHDLVKGLFPKGCTEICLKDEKGFSFPVWTDPQGRTYIMNSRELCMLEYVPELMNIGVSCLRIEAGTYDKDITGKITGSYRDAIDSNRPKSKCSDLGENTTGHYFRKVM